MAFSAERTRENSIPSELIESIKAVVEAAREKLGEYPPQSVRIKLQTPEGENIIVSEVFDSDDDLHLAAAGGDPFACGLFITTASSRIPQASVPEDEAQLRRRRSSNAGVTKAFWRKPKLSLQNWKETPSDSTELIVEVLRAGGGFIESLQFPRRPESVKEETVTDFRGSSVEALTSLAEKIRGSRVI